MGRHLAHTLEADVGRAGVMRSCGCGRGKGMDCGVRHNHLNDEIEDRFLEHQSGLDSRLWRLDGNKAQVVDKPP